MNDWNTQTNEMLKTWGETQKQMWNGWMTLAQGAAAPQTGQLFNLMQALRTGADTGSGLRDGTSQRVAGNIFATPDIMTRSMNLLLQAWQAAAPNIEEGKAWKPDLQKLLQRWRDEFANAPQRAASMQGDFTHLANSLFENWMMTGPLMSMVNQAVASGHPGAAFETGGIGRMPGLGDIGRMLGFGDQLALGEIPRVHITREKMGKLLHVIDTVKDLLDAQRGYKKQLSAALGDSIVKTVEHLAKVAEKGENVTSPHDLMKIWFSIADHELMLKFNTAEFMHTQAKLVEALTAHRKAQREALEMVYEPLEIPTRTEINGAYRSIVELERKVRALERNQKASSGTSTRGTSKKLSHTATGMKS